MRNNSDRIPVAKTINAMLDKLMAIQSVAVLASQPGIDPKWVVVWNRIEKVTAFHPHFEKMLLYSTWLFGKNSAAERTGGDHSPDTRKHKTNC